jgi:aminoglycoside phosphotransferase (APT) family kinase protein
MKQSLEQAFAEYIRAAYPDRMPLSISPLVPICEGWESEVYACTLSWQAASGTRSEDLIVRMVPGIDAVEKSSREGQALRFLNQVGYPVPRLDRIETDPAPLGKPFLIMEKIPGETLWQPLFHGEPARQPALLDLFCGLFARLHTIQPPAGMPILPNPVVHQLERWKPIVESNTLPGFQPAWKWLLERSRAVAPAGLAAVHWDFHPNNILLHPNGSAVVIDWTMMEFSDYRYDLAWTLLLVGSQVSMDWRALVLKTYERHAGHRTADLDFFDAAAAMRRLYSVIAALRYGAEQVGMRPGAEAMMRRSAPALANVYALFRQRTGLTIPEAEAFLEECGL